MVSDLFFRFILCLMKTSIPCQQEQSNKAIRMLTHTTHNTALSTVHAQMLSDYAAEIEANSI